METNKSVRRIARFRDVPLWKIAAELKISEATFTRLMRKPLSPEKEIQIKEIIAKLSDQERSE